LDKVIASVARSTSSVFSVGSAFIGDRGADTVLESEFLRAFKTDSVIPVPKSATKVGGLGVVVVGEDTGTFNKVVSSVARFAGTFFSEKLALVRDGGADSILEGESLGALEADPVVPVPKLAPEIGRLGVVFDGEHTGTFNKVVS